MSMILLRLRVITLVISLSFIMSNVRSGLTYILRAMDARLQTAICAQGNNALGIGLTIFHRLVMPPLQANYTPQFRCISYCTWWYPSSAGLISDCKHPCRGCKEFQFQFGTRWWRTKAVGPWLCACIYQRLHTLSRKKIIYKCLKR